MFFSLLEIEQHSLPVIEMGDTLEFSDIYQEVKGSWVSILSVLLLHINYCSIKNIMSSYLLLVFKCGVNILVELSKWSCHIDGHQFY